MGTISKSNSYNEGKLMNSIRGEKDVQVFISGRLSESMEATSDAVLNYVKENKESLGISEEENFRVEKVQKDELGFTHIKLLQVVNDIKVKDRELNIHFDTEGVVSTINGNYTKAIKVRSYVTGTIPSEEALEVAKKQVDFTTLREEPSVENLIIIKDGNAVEVYKVNLKYLTPVIGNWDIYIDAHTGDVVDKVNNIRYDGAAIGKGTAVDGSEKELNLYQEGSNYEMIDTTKPMSGKISTYNADYRQTEPGTLISKSSNVFDSEKEKASVSAHYNAGVVYDFYKNLFLRNSIDNKGMSIMSTVHYGNSYNNAFWDGTEMVYGDGDGKNFTYFSGDLDVVGHEMTHGVTSFTANLNYKDQSGALNESISDVFGVLIDTYDKYDVKDGKQWIFDEKDWVIGDKIYTPSKPGDALRSLADPKLYDQPDNMSGYVNTTEDEGGVHTNSGIPNKAAFLMAKALGCEKTARIYYRALTTYLNPNSDFEAMKNAAIQAATDLYGVSSSEITAVKDAFTSVGIGVPSGGNEDDSYEPNNSKAEAFSITSGNVYDSLISSSADLDYYKAFITKACDIKITLDNLPADYDLYLINSGGSVVAKSEKGGTSSESISYHANIKGTYYIKVAGYNGAYNISKKYALKATFL